MRQGLILLGEYKESASTEGFVFWRSIYSISKMTSTTYQTLEQSLHLLNLSGGHLN